MESQKGINLLGKTPSQPFKFRTKIGLKYIMTRVEDITPIVILNLKLQC